MPVCKGRVKKQKYLYIHIFGSDPSTIPQIWIKQKKHVVFLGFLAHLEQKKFLKIFHLENFSTLIFMDRFSWLLAFWVEFFCFGPCLPQNSTQKTNNQQSDPVSSQLSWQFSYAGLWSWEKIKPAKLAFDNI